MVSLDSPEKNRKFAESVGAGFVLLSDPGKKSAKAFGVLALGGFFAKRWTFYIGKDGKILAIDKKVKAASHGEDIAKRLKELKVEMAKKK